MKLQSLGRGVAFVVDCPRLSSLRAQLAQLWDSGLTAQDRQVPRLHITVQNKATPEAARALLKTLSHDFEPQRLVFEGLDLWRYLGGPWSLLEAFAFSAVSENSEPPPRLLVPCRGIDPLR